MRHTISLFLLLSAFWLLNSGHYNPLLLFLGFASVVFVLFVAYRMDVVDHEYEPLHLSKRLPAYYYWLFKEVVRANVDVVKRIWMGNSSISPTLSTLNINQKTEMGKVIYANSITLTPGTVAIDLNGGTILVHALTRQAIEDLEKGEMDRRVCRLEE